MLNLLQQMGRKHGDVTKFVIDADIEKARTAEADHMMNTFDSYSLGMLIAKVGLSTLGMAALITMSYIKWGPIPTMFLIAIAILVIWLLSMVLKMIRHLKVIEYTEKLIRKGGNTGTIIMLSIGLVAVLFIMTLVH